MINQTLTETKSLPEIVQEFVDHEGVGEGLSRQQQFWDAFQLGKILVIRKTHVLDLECVEKCFQSFIHNVLNKYIRIH